MQCLQQACSLTRMIGTNSLFLCLKVSSPTHNVACFLFRIEIMDQNATALPPALSHKSQKLEWNNPRALIRVKRNFR